jgi:uncharacterized protein (DUF983 family)
MANNRFVAILRQRCPVCLQGKVFRSFLGAYPNCPHCGVRFEREHGYYLNAMFVAYAIGFILIAPTALYLYLRGVNATWFTILISAELLLLWPFIFRYSRILWMHLDQALDPRQAEEARAADPVQDV